MLRYQIIDCTGISINYKTFEYNIQEIEVNPYYLIKEKDIEHKICYFKDFKVVTLSWFVNLSGLEVNINKRLIFREEIPDHFIDPVYFVNWLKGGNYPDKTVLNNIEVESLVG